MTKFTLTVRYDYDYRHDCDDLVGVMGPRLNGYDRCDTEATINDLLGCDWQDLTRDEFIKKMESCKEVAAFAPVYMYSHSGDTISTSPFSCPWDSGQAGWAVITRSSLKAMGLKNVGQVRGQRHIKGHIQYLDQIMQGNVFGFEVKDENGDHVDSCWGFVGDDIESNGMLCYLDEELHDQAREIFSNYDFAAA